MLVGVGQQIPNSSIDRVVGGDSPGSIHQDSLVLLLSALSVHSGAISAPCCYSNVRTSEALQGDLCFFQPRFGVGEEHQCLLVVEQWVVDAGETG